MIPAWAAAWFVALMGLTLTVRIVDPTGWLGSDDASYYSAAEHVLTGHAIQRVHHHYARMAVVAPVAVSMWLFGESPFTVALPMFVASTLCVMAIVGLGRALWGWCEGLLAATIVSVLPYFRVLSTTAFPDVHVCLWTTVAILLAVMATQTNSRRRGAVLWMACGFVLGLAISAKVFAVAAAAGLGWILWKGPEHPGSRLRTAAYFVIGLVFLFLLEGLFYYRVADDFFFSLRATLAAQSNIPSMTAEVEPVKWSIARMIWDRLAMPLYPSTSGWGWIGVAYWPIVLALLLLSRAARPLAIWALATYVLVAFVPLSFKDGAQPYPVFHGRHVLPACVPFALGLAWMLRRVLRSAVRAAVIERTWPIAFVVIAALSFVNPWELKGFRDRDTGRVGTAIAQISASTQWDPDRCIFMTPSFYWRFRILFPQELRSQLRVAVNDGAPAWWRETCVDIASRAAPLPPPGDAYLIATPVQWHGATEHWDYGVGLPLDSLREWQSLTPKKGVCRLADGGLGFLKPNDASEPLLLLLDGEPDQAVSVAEQASLVPSQLQPSPVR